MNKKESYKREKMAKVLSDKNMSAYALAKALRFKPQTVYNWLYGMGTPNPMVMLDIIKILGVTAQEVLEIFAEGIDE